MKDFDFIVGFDFGHGETSAAVVDVARVSPEDGSVPVEDMFISHTGHEPKVMSVVAYKGNRAEVGMDVYDFQYYDRVEAYFKGPLSTEGRFKEISADQRQSFRDFIRGVFLNLNSNPKNGRLSGKSVGWYAACPSGWSEAQMSEYLNFLREECQVPVQAVVKESRAAYVSARKKLHEQNPELAADAKRIAVLDLGSSTLDITLYAERTFSDGYYIGASKIEKTLLDYFMSTQPDFKDKFERYLAINPHGMDEVLVLLRLAKEDYFNRKKKHPDGNVAFSCPVDWAALTNDETTDPSSLRLKGGDFNALFVDQSNKADNAYALQLRKSMLDFIDRHGGADAVILTGGASLMDFYKAEVLECFGLKENQCVADTTPSYSISQGVAMIGYLDSKCPIVKDEGDLPDGLKMIHDELPEIMKAHIIASHNKFYMKDVERVVQVWKEKDGGKSLEDLLESLGDLIETWRAKSGEILKNLNESLSDTLTESVTNALKDAILLYFGFNAEMKPFASDVVLNLNISEESSKSFLKSIIYVMADTINDYYSIGGWNGESSLKKDRSNDAKLVSLICDNIVARASEQFSTLRLGESINSEISLCRKDLMDYFTSVIRDITCQI